MLSRTVLLRVITAIVTGSAAASAGASAQSTGAIAGRMWDEVSGAPLSHVRVLVLGHDLETSSDERGAFALRGLAPGTYTLALRRLGYEPLDMTVSVLAGRETPVNAWLTPAATMLSADTTLARATRLYGVVADSAWGTIAEAEVTLLGTERRQQTGLDGRFDFVGLPAGSYLVRVRAPGFVTAMRAMRVRPDSASGVAFQLAPDRGRLKLLEQELQSMERRMLLTLSSRALVSRAELEPMGKQPLDRALRHAPAVARSSLLGRYEDACIIAIEDGSPRLSDRPLSSFTSTEVEAVEIYGPNHNLPPSVLPAGTKCTWISGSSNPAVSVGVSQGGIMSIFVRPQVRDSSIVIVWLKPRR
jgi:hypothetical protein